MKYKVLLHPKAIAELEDSYQWYEERTEGLGNRFILSVNKRIEEIAHYPERYARKRGNYREVMIEFFPYQIIYELFKRKKIIFISYIFHTSRNPLLKYKR